MRTNHPCRYRRGCVFRRNRSVRAACRGHGRKHRRHLRFPVFSFVAALSVTLLRSVFPFSRTGTTAVPTRFREKHPGTRSGQYVLRTEPSGPPFGTICSPGSPPPAHTTGSNTLCIEPPAPHLGMICSPGRTTPAHTTGSDPCASNRPARTSERSAPDAVPRHFRLQYFLFIRPSANGPFGRAATKRGTCSTAGS